tara:strand:- start:4535 stop:4891 length:357 start_codon:yes stop_codon:yes gene_type:complete
MKLEENYTIRVYISRGFRYNDSVSDSLTIKLRFYDKPNSEKGTKDKHEMKKGSFNRLCRKILKLYNTDINKVDIHYSSHYTDNNTKLIYPTYIIITDEDLHTDFLMKRRDETIDKILQ